MKETGIHKEVKGFFFPGSPGVLIPTKTAEQLDTGSVTRGIMCTRRKENHLNICVSILIIIVSYSLPKTMIGNRKHHTINFFIIIIHGKYNAFCGNSNNGNKAINFL